MNIISTTNYKSVLTVLVMLLLLTVQSMVAQIPDSILQTTLRDSITNINPSLDTTPRPTTQTVKLSKDSLDAPVNYESRDSMRFDVKNKQIHLYGKAKVTYQEFELTAGYIIFDWGENVVIAEGVKDSVGKPTDLPLFTQGETEPIAAKKLRYNFKTNKGIVYNVTTTQAGGYIKTSKAKLVGKQDSIPYSTDQFFGQDAIYTSCDHDEPHFGIRSQKQKIIPEKLVVVGPSNVEIGGIPTPLWLPFGFFPLAEGQSGGLIFPQNYEFSESFGYGLRGVGWYFGLGERADLKVTGDIYTRGSWGIQASTNYRTRYKYSGNATIGYALRLSGDPETPTFSKQPAFNLRWSHNQDAKAHPTQRFTANVNFQTSGYLSTVNNDAESVLTSSMSSNISYSKSFSGKPFRLSANVSHSQNTKTRQVRFNLPTLNFNMNRIFPFESQNNKNDWYEKIGFTYNMQLQNSFEATDTTIFTQETLESAKFGVKHALPINATFKILKYFNFTPNINYSEKWYIKTIQKNFDPTLLIDADSTFDSSGGLVSINADTTFGTVNQIDQFGFRSLREISMGASLSTQLFGMLNLGKGQAIRHVVKPSVSFTYTPDYSNPFWNYFDSVQLDTRYPFELEQYSYFEGGLYGSPSLNGSQSISFSVNNVVEGKFINKKDTANALRKIKLLSNLSFSGNYNLAADSLNMSVINMSGNTTLFKQVQVNFGMTFDPLAANTLTNQRINEWELLQNGRLARMTNARLSLATSIDTKLINKIFGKRRKKNEEETLNEEEQREGVGRPVQSEFNPNGNSFGNGNSVIPRLQLNYDLRVRQSYADGVDTTQISTHTISFSSGPVNITRKWRVTVGRVGYDFARKQATYPDFQLYRDLHCWEMGFRWQPQRSTYSFYLRVKQNSKLNFLNLPYNKNNYDPLGGF